jgi:hypothetical protein
LMYNDSSFLTRGGSGVVIIRYIPL